MKCPVAIPEMKCHHLRFICRDLSLDGRWGTPHGKTVTQGHIQYAIYRHKHTNKNISYCYSSSSGLRFAELKIHEKQVVWSLWFWEIKKKTDHFVNGLRKAWDFFFLSLLLLKSCCCLKAWICKLPYLVIYLFYFTFCHLKMNIDIIICLCGL